MRCQGDTSGVGTEAGIVIKSLMSYIHQHSGPDFFPRGEYVDAELRNSALLRAHNYRKFLFHDWNGSEIALYALLTAMNSELPSQFILLLLLLLLVVLFNYELLRVSFTGILTSACNLMYFV